MLNTFAMKRLCRFIAGVCALLLMQLPALSQERVVVFAAASLKGALDEAVAQSGQDVVVSYGGSGLLARQVALGAPADLVILANQDWMDWLAGQSGIAFLSQHEFLSNRLVLIGPHDAADLPRVDTTQLLTRLGDGRLATGLTQSVPSGIYARQWLEHIGAWPQVRSRLAETDNVRAALALVARGEAPMGVVYGSDAMAEPAVRVLYDIPADAHGAITYPMAVLNTKNAVQADGFAAFLLSDAGQDIFVAAGFLSRGGTP